MTQLTIPFIPADWQSCLPQPDGGSLLPLFRHFKRFSESPSLCGEPQRVGARGDLLEQLPARRRDQSTPAHGWQSRAKGPRT